METKEVAVDLCCWQLGRTSLADGSQLLPAVTFTDGEQQCCMGKCVALGGAFSNALTPCCLLCNNFRCNDSRSWKLLLTHRGHCKSKTSLKRGKISSSEVRDRALKSSY